MDLNQFIYQTHPQRIIFGSGSIQQLATEIEKLGCVKALVLCTPEQIDQAQMVANLLAEKAVGIFDRAMMHVPIETARQAQNLAQQLGADCAVAIGGGSTTGLGKAIALEFGLPIIAIPTTYAGSEMTPVYGLTENNLKRTGKDYRVLPKTVIYDPDLTLTLPLHISVTSGINAIAHAAEGLYAQDGNPIMRLVAEEGIRALAKGLQQLMQNDQDIHARSECLYGAWLCGTVLGNVGMALHHKLCHTLGGTFNLAHAPTHSIVLAHAIAFNEQACPEITAIICRALNVKDVNAGQALFDLNIALNAPIALKDLDFTEDDIFKAAQIAMAHPYWNPRAFQQEDLIQILQDAYAGNRPQ